MIQRLRDEGLAVALVLVFVLAAFLAFRAVQAGVRARGDEPIRPWMTVPYVAHSHHVQQDALWNALGIPPHRHDHRPLGRIARDQNLRVGDLIATLKGAIVVAPPRHAPSAPPSKEAQ